MFLSQPLFGVFVDVSKELGGGRLGDTGCVH